MLPDEVQRKVKSNLNKMTPNNFDKISDQILEIASQSKHETDGRTLRQVIQLTFEKATDEAHWSYMYAKFCKRMLESMDPNIKDDSILDKNGNIVTGGNLFRKYLLNRCQEEFERGWKVNLPPKPEGDTEEAALLSDEYYIAAAAKRRGLGLVQFIGELYKLGMLTERIMHECVRKLVDFEDVPDEAEVESLTKLLRTIGRNLDSTEKGKPMMDAYFKRITMLIENPALVPRLKFMLMDIVDLRRTGWQTKESDKGPKTIQEIHDEALRAQQEKEAERQRQQHQRPNRPQMGRGDARSFSGGGYGGMMGGPPQDFARTTVGSDDLRRLTSRAKTNQGPASGSTLGPTSMFASRSGSGGRRTLGPNLSRGGDDSASSSRTGTPPAQEKKDNASSAHANMFSLLQNEEKSGEANDAASPPGSTTSSPPVKKASLEGVKPPSANEPAKNAA
jgi:translation initiation factor 4G